MANDALGVLQAEVTKTNSFNGAAYDLVTGTPLRGLTAVVYANASNASGSETVTFKVQHSDNDSTYYDCASGADQVITTSTTATDYVVKIPFITNKRYVRLVATFSATTGTPTCTYSAVVNL